MKTARKLLFKVASPRIIGLVVLAFLVQRYHAYVLGRLLQFVYGHTTGAKKSKSKKSKSKKSK